MSVVIAPGTVVRNRDNGITGVVVPPPPGVEPYPGGVVIVPHGTMGSVLEEAIRLEEIGPENAVPNTKKCGAGKADKCCIFITTGGSGICCERHTGLRWTLLLRRHGMSAKRVPTEPYPDCMNQGGDDGKPG